jgi:hypothetical protein
MKSRKVKILALAVVIVAAVLYSIYDMRRSIEAGPDYSEFRRVVTAQVFDSLAHGLQRYHAFYGRYPQTDEKYFYDSIKTFIHLDRAYVYSDSIHSFVGIGSRQQAILYRMNGLDSYVMYSVGENGIDENGGGDDMMYKK